MTVLQNALCDVPVLDQVRGDLERDRVQYQVEPTWDKYITLVSSAAQRYDRQFALKNYTGSRRVVNYHGQYSHDSSFDDTDPNDFSIFEDADSNYGESYNDVIEAHRGHRVSMPKERWDELGQLGQDAQKKWNEFTDEQKKVILGYEDEYNLDLIKLLESVPYLQE